MLSCLVSVIYVRRDAVMRSEYAVCLPFLKFKLLMARMLQFIETFFVLCLL